MTGKVMINGIEYAVTENLGYSHNVGARAKAVQTEQGERIAVCFGGTWRFWEAKDKIRVGGRYVGQKAADEVKA